MSSRIYHALMVGCLASMCGATACTFTIPDPPTASYRRPPSATTPEQLARDPSSGYSVLSPLSQYLVADADDARLRGLALDSAWRCEQRLSSLVAKMKAARAARSFVAVSSGLATATGALVTTVLGAIKASKQGADHGLDAATIVSASVTMSAGMAALVSAQVDDARSIEEVYQTAEASYSRAYELLIMTRTGTDQTVRADAVIQAMLALSACAGVGGHASASGAGDSAAPKRVSTLSGQPSSSATPAAPAAPAGASTAAWPSAAPAPAPSPPPGATTGEPVKKLAPPATLLSQAARLPTATPRVAP